MGGFQFGLKHWRAGTCMDLTELYNWYAFWNLVLRYIESFVFMSIMLRLCPEEDSRLSLSLAWGYFWSCCCCCWKSRWQLWPGVHFASLGWCDSSSSLPRADGSCLHCTWFGDNKIGLLSCTVCGTAFGNDKLQLMQQNAAARMLRGGGGVTNMTILLPFCGSYIDSPWADLQSTLRQICSLCTMQGWSHWMQLQDSYWSLTLCCAIAFKFCSFPLWR